MMVTKKSLMLDVLKKYPQAQEVLVEYNLGCSACLGAVFEDLETVARANQIDVEELVAKLNDLNRQDKKGE